MSSSSSQLFLPPGTPFPVTVVTIQANASDSVQRGSPLLTYSFSSQTSSPGGRLQVLFGIWDCPVEGTIERWCVKERDVITSDDKAVLYISEPCKHGVQIGGLCALCGKDMTESDYTGYSNEARASIQMTHSANGPKVSLEEAQRIERETAERLLNTRKLSLIVDLDQTIVHATVDPTVGDWIAEGEAWEARQTSNNVSSEAENDSDQPNKAEDDEVNPNWEALKDVKKFRLGPESFGLPPGSDKHRTKGKERAVETQGCRYYVKPRPGWFDFLSSVATKYEMHVYTMGTRAYAEEVCKAIDPDGKLFCGRILSRDESGSLTQKSLQRLFPVDTSMVVIIDDRADVWEWSPNLVKVIPYDFFVGIGDINSAFLPKLDPSTSSIPQMPSATPGRQLQTVPGTTLSTSTPNPSDDDSQSSAIGASPADEEDTEILQKEMIARNSLALEAQVEERPLAKLQEELQEAANGELESESPASSTSSQSESTSKPSETPGEKHHHRKALLKNDDVELRRIKRLLDAVHQRFFEAYDNRPPDKGGKAKFLNKAQPSSYILYDVRIIIPGLRLQTFDGLHLLFSSVIPLDTRPETTDIWNLAEAFGASCHTELSSEVTHLVAAKRGTAKIDQARKRGNIKIVWLAWFTDSIARWERQDETPYLMDEPRSSSATAPDTASSPAPPDAQQISSDPEPDADDWDVEPGSRKADSGTVASGVAAAAPQGDGGTVDEDELDDLKRIEEQSRNLELSLSWEDVDEELREFLASGDDEDEYEDEEDGDGDGDDAMNSKGGGMSRKSENTGEHDRRVGDETGSGPSTPRMRRKRLRSLTPSEAGLNSSDDDYLLRSPLSKRKKLAKDRQNASKLKESISPEEFGHYALPTVPSPPEEDEEDGDGEEESIFGDEDEDDFLARELEEEMG